MRSCSDTTRYAINFSLKLHHGVFNGDGVDLTNKAWEEASN
jgi:hypothetical protein